MPAKQKAAALPDVSPVLFMSVEGEPMSFYLRPGPLKRQLQQLITTGGGTMSNVQQPGAILLIDPEERSSIAQSAAHWYVSTQYIHDCVEKNEQLNLEDYRLNPKMVQRQSPRLRSRDSSPPVSEGRISYTPEEDAAILEYVSKRLSEVGGNRLWQQMEKQRLTLHSWQSMKYRYRVRLAKKQTGDVAETTQNKEKEAKEKAADPDVQKPEEEAASPQKHPAETSLTQVDEQFVPAGSKSEDKGAEGDELQADEPPAETSNSPQAEEPRVDLQTEDQVTAAETAQPEGDEPQSQSGTDDSAPAQPETQLKTSHRKLEEKQKATPSPESSQRRITRRQLELQAAESPGPFGEKLRSSSTTSSPQTSKTADSAVKSTPQKDGGSDEPPPKKARGKSVKPETESQSEESGEAQPSDESDPEPPRKKEKRPLGILELAAREFDSESSEDETPDLERPAEAAAATESVPPSSHGDQETRPTLQPSSVKPPAAEPPSRAHLFIFDSESQELEGPAAAGAAPSHPPPVGGAAALSLTQAQLEEDMQLIRELMTQSEQDLATVTKALLKASGDSSAALERLRNPSSASRQLWSRDDDDSLLSADPDVLEELQDKYGEEEVAKRIVFLDAEP